MKAGGLCKALNMCLIAFRKACWYVDLVSSVKTDKVFSFVFYFCLSLIFLILPENIPIVYRNPFISIHNLRHSSYSSLNNFLNG